MKHKKLRRIFAGMLMSILTCSVRLPGQQSLRPSDEERQSNINTFESVWKTVKERHFDPTFGGLDWLAVREEMRPKIEAARSKDEARSVIQEMLRRLNLSHFTLIPSELYESLAPDSIGGLRDGVTGLQVRVIDGHALVTSVDPGSPAESAGVQPGWEILQIGDRELPDRLAAAAREFEGKPMKELILADAVAGRLTGRNGANVAVSFLDGGNQTIERTLRLAERKGTRFQYGNIPPTYVWLESKSIGEDVGYIAFNMFMAPGIIMPAFNEAIQSFMNSAGIIIDLRGNTGGQSDLVTGMAGWFVAAKERHFGLIQMRDLQLKMVVRPRPEVYRGRVAVLVDGLSLCGAEVFADGLKDLAGARIFGTHTGGATLGGSIEKLPNGDGFMYAVAGFVTANGRAIEGIGIAPDVEVRHRREALLQGRDLVLEAALSWIRNR